MFIPCRLSIQALFLLLGWMGDQGEAGTELPARSAAADLRRRKGSGKGSFTSTTKKIRSNVQLVENGFDSILWRFVTFSLPF